MYYNGDFQVGDMVWAQLVICIVNYAKWLIDLMKIETLVHFTLDVGMNHISCIVHVDFVPFICEAKRLCKGKA